MDRTITMNVRSLVMLLVIFWVGFSAKAQVMIPTNDLVWEYKLENNLNETSGSSFNTGALIASGSNHSFVTGSTPNLGNNTTSAVKLSGDNLTNTQNVIFASNVKLFTLSFWVKLPPNFTSYAEIIRVKDPSVNNYIRVYASSGLLAARLNSSSFGTTDMTPNTSISNVADNTWHHIVVKGTYWAGGAKYYSQLYVDGVKVNERSYGTSLNNIYVFGGTDVTIGSGTSTNDVQIDNLRFYKRDITGAEITTLYDERHQQAVCTNFVNIPDANLKAALLAHGTTITGTGISTIDTDGDGEICESEAQVYTGNIDVSNKNISDLTGIEAFTSITQLEAYDNNITSVDVSSLTNLTRLHLANNQITGVLDVSHMSNLTEFFCYNNNLTGLNVANGNNANFVYMKAYGNANLTCIQKDAGFTSPSYSPIYNTGWTKDSGANYSDNCNFGTPCTNIVNIPDSNLKAALLAHGTTITGTGISIIDTDGDGEICESEAQAYTGTISVSSSFIYDATGIETFINASALFCANNQLTSLDVSGNSYLTYLACDNNQLTSLDVSGNSNLTYLTCYNNQLTSLNIANGNNTNMSHMLAQGNLNLTCIQTDANIVGTNPSNWLKNTTASYSTSCSLGISETDVLDEKIVFYPNPVHDSLFVKSDDKILKINIFDMNGKLVKEIKEMTNEKVVNMKDLPSGVYWLRLYTNHKTKDVKILKQ